jgi:plasmid stabilization system protein ParE
MHGRIHENYRRGLVRRFPYAVFYEYVDETVIVYCVFHTSRDPPKVAAASGVIWRFE